MLEKATSQTINRRKTSSKTQSIRIVQKDMSKHWKDYNKNRCSHIWKNNMNTSTRAYINYVWTYMFEKYTYVDDDDHEII